MATALTEIVAEKRTLMDVVAYLQKSNIAIGDFMRFQPGLDLSATVSLASGNVIFSFVLLLLLIPDYVMASSTAKGLQAVRDGERVNLTITGFNYTSRYIDEFSVNGQGGGNLYVSGPTSGGGGSICCVSYVKGAAAPRIIVRWQSGGCMYRAPGVMADGSTHLAHGL
jgi:hypothetical protein